MFAARLHVLEAGQEAQSIAPHDVGDPDGADHVAPGVEDGDPVGPGEVVRASRATSRWADRAATVGAVVSTTASRDRSSTGPSWSDPGEGAGRDGPLEPALVIDHRGNLGGHAGQFRRLGQPTEVSPGMTTGGCGAMASPRTTTADRTGIPVRSRCAGASARFCSWLR